MSQTLFLSHRLDTLVDCLIEEWEANPIDPLATRSILVANGQIKQWLFLQIAKRKGIAMGIKTATLAEIAPKCSWTEVYGSVYQALRTSTDRELVNYLGGKKGRLLSLTTELTTLFFSYGQHAPSLFDPKTEVIDWQHALLRQLFVEGMLRLPVQTLSTAEPFSLTCFGIDYLPPPFWDFFLRAPSVSIYLFSPCKEFWEDLCTDRERRKLNRLSKKRGASEASRQQLDAYLREAPPLLANWGKLGRETLKILDTYPLQIAEAFPPLEPTTLLQQVQSDLLHFEQPPRRAADRSIQIFQTGSSRLNEMEHLREEILRLSLPYQEIAVLAPTIEPYVPLIEFVFSDMPFRISGFDVAKQSSFRLGLSRLLSLGRWDAETISTLIETPSFYRKQGWDEEKRKTFRSWITAHRIQWGLDGSHCQQELRQTLGEKSYKPQNSWEEGLDRMLEAIVYLRPYQINADLFEEFLSVLLALKEIPLSGEKTPAEWAGVLEKLATQFLLPDLAEEADAAVHESFRLFLRELRTAEIGPVPFDVIQKGLFSPCPGQIHASHLHAIRFAPLEEAALLPAKALFLIGMDEESFPRQKIPSSLDLLRRQNIHAPESADRDRYLFLQALFSAQERLTISYGHLSAEEGKPVAPALPVQELISQTGVVPIPVNRPSSAPKKNISFWPSLSRCPDEPLPEGEMTLSLAELRALARHPWKFFLQNVQGIYLNEPLEDSFLLQKGRLLRAALEKPLDEVFSELPQGALGEALRLDLEEKVAEWQHRLTEWNVKPFTLLLQENCSEKHWDGAYCIAPPLELRFDRLTVRLVGEVKNVVSDGFLCTHDDHISGILKAWPEALAVSLVLNAPHLYLLKNGKKRNLSSAESSLKAFVAYYFRCLKAPSPLLADWADALLRKGAAELDKKMKKKSEFDDPILDWVLARTELPGAEEILAGWGPCLKETFAGLVSLY